MLVAQSMATRLGEGRKAQIITFGCQMNERDAETMRGLLVHMGYTMTDRTDEADLILFNTCSVRENPERKVYGRVGLLKELKAKKPWLKIGICGCMPQQRAERQRIAETLPHVDLVFGTKIGRASCRERGYGTVAAVRVSEVISDGSYSKAGALQ